MVQDDLYGYSPKEAEKEERREKKQKPRMNISGRSVFGLAEIISKRAAEGPSRPKKKKRRRRK
ncbi:hypothetical protein A3J33_01710 [candidate division WWE3 bacterium RIFCSPLOWO2_02_FULL_53_10]|uniref:Uncharacterized protein n=2 Tax=Katanobacteria TaxID=422282 RepID=A0A1F4W464_UNCKA|nr:MAG: hypothetical protein A2890_01790 [candidate division WWE3 bacterium RIFCSPLOWO2_01_FULL_53_14]OGC64222.1 MAG: hypothetical protein A3J33_01710 [candidate division WWE3 bacterium RIFCSPLOWO2_02_FULL_53_10]